MKKIFYIILCIALSLALTACGGKESDTPAPTAESTVEPTAEPAAAYDGPWVLTNYSMNSYIHSKYVYDENGRIIQETSLNSQNDYSTATNYTYTDNADGTTTIRRMMDGEAISGDEFILDANGWCIESVYYSALTSDPAKMFTEDNIESRTTYEYDEAGRLIRVTCHTITYDWGSYIKEYSYDENNRIISRTERDYSTGDVISSFTISYSEDGSSAQTTYTRGSDSSTDNYIREDFTRLDVLTSTTYKHSERGGHWMEYSYEYDENGVLSSVSYKNINNLVPVEYFIGMGHLMEELKIHDNLTFKPLSLVLEEQAVN